MKRFFFLIPMLFSFVLFASCSESIDQPSGSSIESAIDVKNLLTKSIDSKLSTGVTQEDVEDYLVYRQKESLEAVKDIVRYDIDEGVYVYIVNMKRGGWYLLSGDYSSVPVIAQCNDGELDVFKTNSQYKKAFFNSIGNRIRENRMDAESDQVKSNRKQWILAKSAAKLSTPKSRDNDIDTGETIIEYYRDTLVNNLCQQLTSTSWDPSYPFNNAMPLYGNNKRCLAGCAVVAIAQLVYYTHFAFGYPNDTFESASCSQYYNAAGTPPYNFNFSNPSTTCWNGMGLTASGNYFTTYATALYALVSSRSNTQYLLDDDGYGIGSTSPSNIPSTLSLFSLTGASPQSYSRTTIINELESDRPVLGYGGSSLYDTVGHIFLYDGYSWLVIRDTEIIYDMDGNVLSQDETTYNYFKWFINTGDTFDGYHIQVAEGYYYPYNRGMFIGWS